LHAGLILEPATGTRSLRTVYCTIEQCQEKQNTIISLGSPLKDVITDLMAPGWPSASENWW